MNYPEFHSFYMRLRERHEYAILTITCDHDGWAVRVTTKDGQILAGGRGDTDAEAFQSAFDGSPEEWATRKSD